MEEKKSNIEIVEKPSQKEQPKSNIPASIEDEFDAMSKNKLKEVAGQLYYQNQQLVNRIKSMDMTNVFKRLDYLFKVVDNIDKYPKKFTDMVIEEICSGIYPEENNETEK